MQRVRWTSIERNEYLRPRRAPLHPCMNTGRADINRGGANDFFIPGFVNLNCAERLQPLCKRGEKTRGHMLHDHNGNRKVSGKPGKDLFQSSRSAGRGPNGHDGWIHPARICTSLMSGLRGFPAKRMR